MTLTRQHAVRIVNVVLTVNLLVLALIVGYPLIWVGVGWYARTTFAEW